MYNYYMINLYLMKKQGQEKSLDVCSSLRRRQKAETTRKVKKVMHVLFLIKTKLFSSSLFSCSTALATSRHMTHVLTSVPGALPQSCWVLWLLTRAGPSKTTRRWEDLPMKGDTKDSGGECNQCCWMTGKYLKC